MIRKRKFSDSRVQKRSVRIGKLFTSVTVEEPFWEALKQIAKERQLPLNTLLTDINKQRRHANLSSVVRLYVLDYHVRLAAERAKSKRRRAH